MKKEMNPGNASLALITSAFLLLLLLAGCNLTGMAFKEKPLVLGYCPAMQGIANELQAKNANLIIRQFDSTADAFHALNSAIVDAVLN